MKIISGIYSGRKIVMPKNKDFRPTTGKLKESIFSIITSGKFCLDGKTILNEAIVLDLFCGSGAFGFEALSRGAKQVIFVDSDDSATNACKQTANSLGIGHMVNTLTRNALLLPIAKQQVDVIFIDPPYDTNLINDLLKHLLVRNWCKSDTIIIIESSKQDNFQLPDNVQEIDMRVYGRSKITILKVSSAQPE